MDCFSDLPLKLFHLHSTFSNHFGAHFKHMKPEFLEFTPNTHCNLALSHLADLSASYDHPTLPSENGL